jgi:N-acetylneuraminic acid mutarotase
MRINNTAMRIFLASLIVVFIPTLAFSQGLGIWTHADTSGFTPRYGLASAVLDGKIYVMGGNEDGRKEGGTFVYFSNKLEVYDPGSNRWTTPVTTGVFTARQELAACAVKGKIYVIGGTQGTPFNYVEIFDPVYNSWDKPGTGMPTARAGLVTEVLNDQIYAIGGVNAAGTFLNTVEVYDPIKNRWTIVKPAGWLRPMANMTSCVLNNKIYVLGGYDGLTELDSVYVFDPSNTSWTSLPSARSFSPRKQTGCGVINGKIYLMGGFVSDFGNPVNLNDVEVYDSAASTWDTVITRDSMTSRYGFTTQVVSGKLYAFGGTDGVVPLNRNEVFFPTTSSVSSDPLSAAISLSPNPTMGLINLHGAQEIRRVSITDILGVELMNVTNDHQSDLSIDLSKFPQGVYYAKIITPTSTEIKMIVRQ